MQFARFSSLLLGCLLAGALAASPAAAAWSAPFDLSAPGQTAATPQVAIDAEGDTVFTWSRFDGAFERIQTRARSATGTLSPVQALSGAGQNALFPQVAIDDDGDAVFAWRRTDGGGEQGIQARARSAAGTLSPVQTLSTPGQDATTPQVAIDADGDAVFAWRRFDGANIRVQTRTLSAAGVLSPVQTMSKAGEDVFDPPGVAVDADGDAVFTWRRFDGTNERIQTRARSAAGVLSPIKNLSAGGRDAFAPQVDVDSDGDAVFTWERSDGTNTRVQARARSSADVLSAVQDLSAAGQDAATPQVAVDPDGDAVFTWRRFDGTNFRVQARGRSAAGALSAVQDFSAAGEDAELPQVGVDADGDAVLIWKRDDGVDTIVQARTRSAAGVKGSVVDLSSLSLNPQVAVNAGGGAAGTWTRFDGANDIIQGAVGP